VIRFADRQDEYVSVADLSRSRRFDHGYRHARLKDRVTTSLAVPVWEPSIRFIKVPSAVRILKLAETEPFVDKVQSSGLWACPAIVMGELLLGLDVSAAIMVKDLLLRVTRLFGTVPISSKSSNGSAIGC
jgi:hypothetical protein